jgi:hypothetical protein
VIRTVFRLAVIVCAFTVFSLVNTALSWHLPLPDLLPNSEPTPPCVLPGAPGWATRVHHCVRTAGRVR